MEISLTQVFLGCISFGVGYYAKARFEINQEALIKKLQSTMEEMEKDAEEVEKKMRYQLWEVGQVRDRLSRELRELKEKVKAGAFESIAKEKVEKKSKKNALQNFL